MSPIMKKQIDNVNQLDVASAVFESIHTVMHLYRSQQLAAVRAGEQGITHMESRVLSFFSHRQGSTLSDLVQHSGRDKAQMTRLIRRLRDDGFLEAQEDALDRRNIRLQLSPAGALLHRQIKESAAPVLQAAIKGLSAEQSRELVALLTIVKDNLER